VSCGVSDTAVPAAGVCSQTVQFDSVTTEHAAAVDLDLLVDPGALDRALRDVQLLALTAGITEAVSSDPQLANPIAITNRQLSKVHAPTAPLFVPS